MCFLKIKRFVDICRELNFLNDLIFEKGINRIFGNKEYGNCD